MFLVEAFVLVDYVGTWPFIVCFLLFPWLFLLRMLRDNRRYGYWVLDNPSLSMCLGTCA